MKKAILRVLGIALVIGPAMVGFAQNKKPTAATYITKEQVEQAILVIEKRLNALGTKEPLIARQGSDGILVQMPGVEPEESASIRTTLEKVAKLELREVSRRNDEPGADGKSLAQRVMDGKEIVPGYRAYTYKHKDADGNETKTAILLNRRMALGGCPHQRRLVHPLPGVGVRAVREECFHGIDAAHARGGHEHGLHHQAASFPGLLVNVT